VETGIPCKSTKVSDEFEISRNHIYDYSVETFGYVQAERYQRKVSKALLMLSNYYLAYPECRYIATKSQMYRNIVLDKHLIIYRITEQRIEVLDIVHSASSIGKIRDTRKIHI